VKSITFIGNGNMAFSIACGLKDSYKIEVIGRDIEKLNRFEKDLGVKIEKTLLDGANIEQKTIILCIKPANVEEVSKKLIGKARVIYSVLAGTTIEKLKNNFKTDAVVRAMPNLAASVNSSMTTLSGDEAFKEEAILLLSSIGSTRWLSSQKEIDIATALAGSGPAYLALVAEALADGAVKQGLKREDAIEITKGLFGGFSKLIDSNHPAILKDKVMSPGGTTAYGYSALEDSNVRSGFIKAIESAYKRALEL
jgi:pyrroline-5-carboxylate reductase